MRESLANPERIEEIQNTLSRIPPIVMILIIILQSLIAGLTINALAGFGEELGWRAYMLRHLRHWSFMKVCLLTGSVWGIWHLPLILMGHNYPNYPFLGIIFMTIFCTSLSPIITYLVIKSKSVISASIYHGTINASAGIHLLYLGGGDDSSNGLTGYAGFITIALITFMFYLYDRYITKENIFTSTIDTNLN